MRRPLAVTTGEPAGVGPEICALISSEAEGPLVLLGDRKLLAERAATAGTSADYPDYEPGTRPPRISVLHVPLRRPCRAGLIDSGNARYVLDLLDRATDGCLRGEFTAMVTAPVQKSAIADAGIPFVGHTEYLAARCHTDRVVMMLVGGGMRVALATIHLPLREVPDAITSEGLEQTLRILERDLRTRFGIERPRILVAGLNPHAGESGKLGTEETVIIEPVISRLRGEGMRLEGPLPADTLFQPKYLDRADAVLAMYHDQGLTVLKHASFGEGVNVTLGLPIVRTSVDHGTALDIAGYGKAGTGSMRAALRLASDLGLAAERAGTT